MIREACISPEPLRGAVVPDRFTTSFWPTARPPPLPPSRYTAPSAMYLTRKAGRDSGCCARAADKARLQPSRTANQRRASRGLWLCSIGMAGVTIRAVIDIVFHTAMLIIHRGLVMRVTRHAGEDRKICRIHVTIVAGGPLPRVNS